MNRNIAIICHKREIGKQVASMLASQLEMYFLEIFDMIEFDDNPRTLSESIELFGKAQVRKHEKSLIFYASEFSNTVFSCESGAVDNLANINALKSTSILVYLHSPKSEVKQSIEKSTYKTPILKKFFSITDKTIDNRISISQKNADIKTNITNKSVFKICAEILREIKTKYNGEFK